MKTSSQEYAYVSSAIGGSLSQVSFEGGGGRSRINTPCGGGARGDLKGFSRASRRNLLRKLASIDRSAFRAYLQRQSLFRHPHLPSRVAGAYRGLQRAPKVLAQASYEGVRDFLRLLEAGDTEERRLAFPPASLRSSYLRFPKGAPPFRWFVLVGGLRKAQRGSPARGDTRSGGEDLEEGYEFCGAVRGQARAVSRGGRDGSNLGYVEREDASR
jgi:hypothetical protein